MKTSCRLFKDDVYLFMPHTMTFSVPPSLWECLQFLKKTCQPAFQRICSLWNVGCWVLKCVKCFGVTLNAFEGGGVICCSMLDKYCWAKLTPPSLPLTPRHHLYSPESGFTFISCQQTAVIYMLKLHHQSNCSAVWGLVNASRLKYIFLTGCCFFHTLFTACI